MLASRRWVERIGAPCWDGGSVVLDVDVLFRDDDGRTGSAFGKRIEWFGKHHVVLSLKAHLVRVPIVQDALYTGQTLVDSTSSCYIILVPLVLC